MIKFIISFCAGILTFWAAECQVLLNEASNRNLSQIPDSSGSYPDWIELYNTGSDTVGLYGYYLSDDLNQLKKWMFPNYRIPPQQWAMVWAVGEKPLFHPVEHWETVVFDNDLWSWIPASAGIPANWNSPGFDALSWNRGRGGFGFGDGDDRTLTPSSALAVYTRIPFNVPDTSLIVAAMLHVDYDDGFVAYLNGYEIARSNIDGTPLWNTPANASREAIMYQTRVPESFVIPLSRLKTLLRTGENILAVEVHNEKATSADMSLRTFLSFGLATADRLFMPVPAWFNASEGAELRTSFKIDRNGETLYFSDPTGHLIDRMEIPGNLPVNYSVGRVLDGSNESGFFYFGTPGRSNRNRQPFLGGISGGAEILPSGGFYSDEVMVTIAADEPDAPVRYTIDGQNPNENSPVYSGPIRITRTQVVKARVFAPGKLPGPVSTRTYFIRENPTPATYISLTVDSADLYGDQGIYDNWWTDWKRPATVEIFEQGTHDPIVNTKAAIKIDGGAGGSRHQPQRSFRIEPGHGVLGEGDIQYPLIPAKPNRRKYETFYLRNGSNQYLFYPVKDAIETRCMGDSTFNVYSGYAPVQVYLNGQYWGFYELREKQDADFFRQHEGTDPDSLELLSVSYFYGGTLRGVEGRDPVSRFQADYSRFLSLDPKKDDFWTKANRYFDLENYTDYICAQSWIADVDWPYNNIRIYRSPETGGRWRFTLIDLELALEPNGWQNSSFDHIAYMRTYDSGFPYIHIWQRSMENARYRNYFINRYSDLMNTVWRKQRLEQIANEIYSVTRPELPATWIRWGDRGVPVNAWMQQVDLAHQTLIGEFANRSRNVRNHILSNFNISRTAVVTLNVEPKGSGTIRISTVEPSEYPFTGTWFCGIPIRIEAFPAPGYVFERWDSVPGIRDLINPVFEDTLARSAIFTAHFTPGTFSQSVIVSELNYNSGPDLDSDDWIEFRNLDSLLAANLTGWYFTDGDPEHRYDFPRNTLIPPGGFLVIARSPAKFEGVHPGVGALSGLEFGFGANGDGVRLYSHDGKLVESFDYLTTQPWPTAVDGQGPTLERMMPPGVPTDPFSWFAGCPGGSPGRPWSPCSSIVIDIPQTSFNLSVHPNPATDRVKLLVTGSGDYTYQLYNHAGVLLLTEGSRNAEVMIPMDHYPSGMYLIRVTLEDQSTQTIRFILR